MTQQDMLPPTGPPAGPRRRTIGGLSGRAAAAATAAGLMAGGALGGYVLTQAASPSPSPSSGSSSSGGSGSSGNATTPGDHGTFHSNENPQHEAGESAAREAQENAGQRPTVP